ncbi:MAG: hypothetical protein ACJAYK_001321 [Crocinitomicaceae bacterium]
MYIEGLNKQRVKLKGKLLAMITSAKA